jgi:hypothetical protein
MANPAKHPPEDFYNGEAMRHLHMNLARALDHSPKEVELLHTHIIESIHALGPTARSMCQHELVQAVYQPSVAAITKSKTASSALDRIIANYDKLPSTPTIRLAKDGENSILIAIAIGLVCGALIVGAVCLYYAARY